jgi:hypothetical protein
MEKVVRDGKVAVVFQPEFGAGWYTWNTELPEIVFDPNIVYFLQNRDLDKLSAYIELKYPDRHFSGFDSLVVTWIPEGTEFKIDEYDGRETIVFKERIKWLEA